MSNSATIFHMEGIGTVKLRPDHRCKRLSIRIKPFEGVTVMFPPGYPQREALAFVEEKKGWIRRNRQKVEATENSRTVFDENVRFRTRSFELKMKREPRSDVRMTLNEGILHVACPDHLDIADEPLQKTIRQGIEKAMRIEAQQVLPHKVRKFASRYNFKPQKVFVKNLKSRWGSCSSVNNINLNLQLMRLPEHLIDYVVLHELCHTVEKNHGPRFWRLLNQVTSYRAKELAREMKKYRTTIY